VKIVATLLASLVILNAGAVEGLAVTTFLLAGAALAGLSGSRMREALRPLAWFFALLFGLHLFFTEGRPIVAALPAVTWEGLWRGAAVTWQFVALVVGAAILTMTTDPSGLVGGFEKLLRPFNRLGLPSHDLAVMVSVALRFVPALLEEVERMREAQVARGADFGAGGPVRRLRKMASLVIPMILCTFRRADELALPWRAAATTGGPGPTARAEFTRTDYAALLAVAGFLIGVEALRFLPL
jgi:energy-coupling factor transporter transmembrane protein EcfT